MAQSVWLAVPSKHQYRIVDVTGKPEARSTEGADLALAIGPFPAEGKSNPDVPFYFSLATAEKITVKASSLDPIQALRFE